MAFIPRPHEIYKHFKGNLYQITAVAEHTETGEQMVVYQALYGDFKTYVRPLAMFVSEVDTEKYPDASQKFRFELQGDNRARAQERGQESVRGTEREVSENAERADGQTMGNTAQEVRETEQLLNLDPMVSEFLDADTYEQRLNILAGLHHRITDEMITTMAVACDVEVPDGEVEERYSSLKNCLLTLEKYECNRLR